MNIYEAIMAAADHIERNPKLLDFLRGHVPEGFSGQPVCHVGWIARFAGEQPMAFGVSEIVCPRILGVPFFRDGTGECFTARMDNLCDPGEGWTEAQHAAKYLRRYAAKYHAPAKVVQPPDWNAIASRRTVGEHEKSQELA